MIRREFFSWLGGLPFFGFLKKEENREWKNGPIEQLLPIVGELKSVRRPKLRIWSLGDSTRNITPTEEAYQKLAGIISNWDKESDLDIIWDDLLHVQQFDITKDDMNIVLGPGDAKVEEINVDAEGKLTARIICKEPFIRVINDHNENA